MFEWCGPENPWSSLAPGVSGRSIEGAVSLVLPPIVPGVEGSSSPPECDRSTSRAFAGVPGGLLGTDGISGSVVADALGWEDVREGCKDSSRVDW